MSSTPDTVEVSVTPADFTKARVNVFVANTKRHHCTDVAMTAGVMTVTARQGGAVVGRYRVLSEQNQGYEIEDADGRQVLARLDTACGCNCK